MRSALRILTRLSAIGAVILVLGANAVQNETAGLWGGLFLILAVLCGLLEDYLRRLDNRQKPITTVEATVISHRIVRERVGRRQTAVYNHVLFRTAEGKLLEFRVSELDYDDFDVGETGPLRYRGGEFLSFGVKDKSGITPMAPLPDEYESRPEPKSAIQRAREQIASLWIRLTARPGKPEAQEKHNGILTHELDE